MEKSSLGRMVRGYIERAKGEARDIAMERRVDRRISERAPLVKRDSKQGELAKLKNTAHLDVKSARFMKDDGLKCKTPTGQTPGADPTLQKFTKKSRVLEQKLVLTSNPTPKASNTVVQAPGTRQRSRSPMLPARPQLRSKCGLTSQQTVPTEMQRPSANLLRRDVSWVKTAPLFSNESRSLSRTVIPSFNISRHCLPEIADFSKTQRNLMGPRKYRTVQEIPGARNLLSNAHLDDFEVVQPLGKGAYATTSLAIHKATQIAVALKTYVYGETNLMKSAVDSECDILADLNHRNVVQYYGRLDKPGQTILILE